MVGGGRLIHISIFTGVIRTYLLQYNTIQCVLLAINNTMLLAIKHTCMSEQN